MIAAAEIEQMSRAERLRTMEMLWRSISAEPTELKSPSWHKTVLKGRLAKVESGKAKFLTIAQLKKQLARRSA